MKLSKIKRMTQSRSYKFAPPIAIIVVVIILVLGLTIVIWGLSTKWKFIPKSKPSDDESTGICTDCDHKTCGDCKDKTTQLCYQKVNGKCPKGTTACIASPTASPSATISASPTASPSATISASPTSSWVPQPPLPPYTGPRAPFPKEGLISYFNVSDAGYGMQDWGGVWHESQPPKIYKIEETKALSNLCAISSMIIISFPSDALDAGQSPFDERNFKEQYRKYGTYFKDKFAGSAPVLFSVGGVAGSREDQSLYTALNTMTADEIASQINANKIFDGCDFDIEPTAGNNDIWQADGILQKIKDIREKTKKMGTYMTCATLGYYDNHPKLFQAYIDANLDNYGVMVYPGETTCDKDSNMCTPSQLETIVKDWADLVGISKMAAGILIMNGHPETGERGCAPPDGKLYKRPPGYPGTGADCVSNTEYIEKYAGWGLKKSILWAFGGAIAANFKTSQNPSLQELMSCCKKKATG